MSMENLFWRYKGIVEFMEDHPGMYGMDYQRTDIHTEIKSFFKNKEKRLNKILHNMSRDLDYECFKSYMDGNDGMLDYCIKKNETGAGVDN